MLARNLVFLILFLVSASGFTARAEDAGDVTVVPAASNAEPDLMGPPAPLSAETTPKPETSPVAAAQPVAPVIPIEEMAHRHVSLEWETIARAKSYDVEFKSIGKREFVLQYHSDQTSWSGDLPLGKYIMHIRSVDARGVTGSWSEVDRFTIKPTAPKTLTPTESFKVVGTSKDKQTVSMTWSKSPGTQRYKVDVKSTDGHVHQTKTVDGEAAQIELPVALTYQWKVTSLCDDGEDGGESQESKFELDGKNLDGPVIVEPENEFVRLMTWSRPDFTRDYDVHLSYFNPKTKKWQIVRKLDASKNQAVPIEESLPGGHYRLEVRGNGDLRPPSKVSRLNFDLYNGDRSPASEFNVEVMKSVDHFNGWYGMASYLITQVNYSSADYNSLKATQTKFSALGGTGRIGAGFWKKDQPWGFLGILDLSGFTDQQNKNVTFGASEMSALWRKNIFTHSEVRVQLGLYYKEEPIAFSDPETLKVISYSNLATIGPHVGAEFWHAFSPWVGAQANIHLYEGLYGVEVPNGQQIDPTLSWQIGLLGSYRFNRAWTGLIGYAHRQDAQNYEIAATSPFAGAKNQVSITGDYLNMFIEFKF